MGYEQIQEIENPQLAQERMKELFEQKGYPFEKNNTNQLFDLKKAKKISNIHVQL
jgi:hypothetical protein